MFFIPFFERPLHAFPLRSMPFRSARSSQGVLRGYDPFMNLVLDETTDPASSDKKMGMVIIRGNSVVQFEILDPLRF